MVIILRGELHVEAMSNSPFSFCAIGRGRVSLSGGIISSGAKIAFGSQQLGSGARGCAPRAYAVSTGVGSQKLCGSCGNESRVQMRGAIGMAIGSETVGGRVVGAIVVICGV